MCHSRHPFLSTPSRRAVVFTISISHLIRHARATGIKYHSTDSTSIFRLIPSVPSLVTVFINYEAGGRDEFKEYLRLSCYYFATSTGKRAIKTFSLSRDLDVCRSFSPLKLLRFDGSGPDERKGEAREIGELTWYYDCQRDEGGNYIFEKYFMPGSTLI